MRASSHCQHLFGRYFEASNRRQNKRLERMPGSAGSVPVAIECHWRAPRHRSPAALGCPATRVFQIENTDSFVSGSPAVCARTQICWPMTSQLWTIWCGQWYSGAWPCAHGSYSGWTPQNGHPNKVAEGNAGGRPPSIGESLGGFIVQFSRALAPGYAQSVRPCSGAPVRGFC